TASSTLSLHDALPIYGPTLTFTDHHRPGWSVLCSSVPVRARFRSSSTQARTCSSVAHRLALKRFKAGCSGGHSPKPRCRKKSPRSEEHTSELQSRFDL